jgi:hypothetical protein
MAKHFEFLGEFRVHLSSSSENSLSNSEERILLLKMLIKCSDVGHAAKITDLH